MNGGNKFTREIKDLEKKIVSLEQSINTKDDSSFISSLLTKMNAVQALIDQIEIELDKLEMRVSAIEHMDFRFRTGGQ